MTGDQWYYRLGGRPHGPFTPTQFRKLIRGKTVTAETEVSPDGRTWQPLRDVESGTPPEPGTTPPDGLLAPTLFPGSAAPPADATGGKKPPG